jgi:hypothetical protein
MTTSINRSCLTGEKQILTHENRAFRRHIPASKYVMVEAQIKRPYIMIDEVY